MQLLRTYFLNIYEPQLGPLGKSVLAHLSELMNISLCSFHAGIWAGQPPTGCVVYLARAITEAISLLSLLSAPKLNFRYPWVKTAEPHFCTAQERRQSLGWYDFRGCSPPKPSNKTILVTSRFYLLLRYSTPLDPDCKFSKTEALVERSVTRQRCPSNCKSVTEAFVDLRGCQKSITLLHEI